MKKSLFMLGAAIVALSSCTKDEVLNVNENRVISFESHVNKNTRAVDNTTKAGLQNFYVYGYHTGSAELIFNGKEVTKSGEGWTYTDPVEWTANDYYFGAYATANTSGTITSSFANKALTMSATNDNDLIAAVAYVQKKDDLSYNTVGLNFKHMLAKVKFTFTNSNSTKYDMVVSNLSLIDTKQKGTCTYTYVDNTTTTVEWDTDGMPNENLTYAITNNISDENLVIPVLDDNTQATFTVDFYQVGTSNKVSTKTYTVNLKNINISAWTNGYLYNYTAALAPDSKYIVFDVIAVDDTNWNTPTDKGITF